jgi:hypothetical protein
MESQAARQSGNENCRQTVATLQLAGAHWVDWPCKLPPKADHSCSGTDWCFRTSSVSMTTHPKRRKQPARLRSQYWQLLSQRPHSTRPALRSKQTQSPAVRPRQDCQLDSARIDAGRTRLPGKARGKTVFRQWARWKTPTWSPRAGWCC